MVGVELRERITSEQSLEGGEAGRYWEKKVPDTGNSQCKDTKSVAALRCRRNRRGPCGQRGLMGKGTDGKIC